MSVYLLTAITTIGWAFYHIFIKLSSGKIYPALGYIVLNVTALGIGAIFVMHLKYVQGAALYITKPGIMFAALAGCMVVLAEMAFFYTFSNESARLGVLVPLMAAGSVALVAIISTLFLGEPFTWKTGLGITLALASVVLLSEV